MFTLQQKENPLAQFLGQVGTGAAQGFVESRDKRNKQQELSKLSAIKEDTSPIEAWRVISMLNIPNDEKKGIIEGYTKFTQEKSPGPSGTRPVPSEVGNSIKTILAENPNASAEDLQLKLDEAGIPRDYSKPYVTQRNKQAPVSERPIPSDQLQLIKSVRENPDFADMDEVQRYEAFTNAGVSPVLADREAKLRSEQLGRKQKEVEGSLTRHKDFIDSTTGAAKGWETEMKPRLLQMQALNDKELASPAAAAIFDALGLPLSLMEDPSSELYEKLSQDLLKGLPEVYGTRILKVEVENFLRTIPKLINSPDGRRMIASNMLKLGEMKEVAYRNMRDMQRSLLDQGKALPADFEQRVYDQSKSQIDQINNDFVKMAQVEKVPPGMVPVFNPQGIIIFIPNDKDDIDWATQNGGRRIW